MPIAGKPESLERRIGLRSAVLFNMLEMIGVGPFITLPLVIAAAGYRLSVWAWVLGAVIAVADGLVWAELGAVFPTRRRVVCVSARDLPPRGRGQLAELSLRVAGELYGAACRLPRGASGCRVSGVVLAGAGRRRRSPRCPRCTTPTLPRRRRACW